MPNSPDFVLCSQRHQPIGPVEQWQSVEKVGQSFTQTCHVSGPTFPNYEHFPIGGTKGSQVCLVSLSIFLPLAAPIVTIFSWRYPTVPTFVQVPETSVDKNDFVSRNKDKVWLSWKGFAMERIPIAQRVNCFSDAHFRNSVLPAHRTHTGGSLFGRKIVSHQAVPREPILERRPLRP